MIWWPERGYGYYPVDESDKPYDATYFNKYVRYAETDLGAKLTQSRINLVNAFAGNDEVVDIGIGSGQFVESRNKSGGRTLGYDVNPIGVKWLMDRGLWRNVYDGKPVPSVTCWDSLEHIRCPWRLLCVVQQFVFMAIPIFDGVDGVLTSKHYRRDEHYWYFTEKGLMGWMSNMGFETLLADRRECELGREAIGTFVFERINE